MRRSLIHITLAAGCLSLATGCIVVQDQRPGAVAEVEAEGPVVEGPGVNVIEVEPDPAARVYVYDPGFPPGVYFYNGFYWYGGYYYDRDIFIRNYVNVNIREHRFVDRAENRRVGTEIERRHREEFARTRGRRAPANVHGREHLEVGHGDRGHEVQ